MGVHVGALSGWQDQKWDQGLHSGWRAGRRLGEHTPGVLEVVEGPQPNWV